MAEINKVLSQTRKNGSETLVELNDAKKTKVWRPTASVSGGAVKQSAPGDISGGLATETNTGNRFGNFSLALKNAINEGSAARKGMQMNLVQPFVSGGVGGMSSVVDFIKQNSKTSATSVLSSVMGGFEAQIEEEKAKRNFTFDIIKTMAADGSLGSMPDSALLAMGAQAGLEQGTLLAWKSRISTATKQSEQKGALELKKVEAEIGALNASAAASRRGPAGADAPSSVSERQTAAVAAIQGSVSDAFNQYRGEDGKVSPDIYTRVRQNATRLGVAASTFDDTFGTELSQAERYKLGITPTGSNPSGGSDSNADLYTRVKEQNQN